MCGNSFVPDPKKTEEAGDSKPEKKRTRKKRALTKRPMMLAAVVIVVLGLVAGLVSFMVSREILRSREVAVVTGTEWKCTDCDRIYKKRVLRLTVPSKDAADYTIEVTDGKCQACLYGPLAGRFQDFFESLSENGFFHGYTVDVEPEAAVFIEQHADLLPAQSEQQVAPLATELTPVMLGPEFSGYAGRPVVTKGRVVYLQVLAAADGTSSTYLELTPVINGVEQKTNVRAFYPGQVELAEGDSVVMYMLPVDVVRYGSGEGARAELLGLALFIRKV